MIQKIGRLFVIKTRFEAWLVIYAIALGAVERGRHYLDTYPGWGGWMLAIADASITRMHSSSDLPRRSAVPYSVTYTSHR